MTAPLIYRRQFAIVDASATRSFGALVIQRATLGYRYDDRRSLPLETLRLRRHAAADPGVHRSVRADDGAALRAVRALRAVHADLRHLSRPRHLRSARERAARAARWGWAWPTTRRARPGLSRRPASGDARAGRIAPGGGLRARRCRARSACATGRRSTRCSRASSTSRRPSCAACASCCPPRWTARARTRSTSASPWAATRGCAATPSASSRLRGWSIAHAGAAVDAARHVLAARGPAVCSSVTWATPRTRSPRSSSCAPTLGLGLCGGSFPQLNSSVIRLDSAVPLVGGIDGRRGLPGASERGLSADFLTEAGLAALLRARSRCSPKRAVVCQGAARREDQLIVGGARGVVAEDQRPQPRDDDGEARRVDACAHEGARRWVVRVDLSCRPGCRR